MAGQVVRGAILAEWSNSRVGSGLLWKIEIGRKGRKRKGEKVKERQGFFWCFRGRQRWEFYSSLRTKRFCFKGGIQLMEVVITIDELRRAGINVTVVPVRKRLQVDACQGIDIVADAPISDCAGADFDLILPPGGMPGAATLGDGDILESMVKKHADEGQPYARFRVAPAVALGSWGLMHGFAFWFDVELNGW
ncbi:Protein DJ-1-like B [Vitis vinifera]|uniref:Protein DJ-1-like B n=1 Tax=Vitis vinifera TaxID=29760 RepID=A0A438HJW6_VITVI|nr:Protein DJ-1-like B [Vitis vinifera]